MSTSAYKNYTIFQNSWSAPALLRGVGGWEFFLFGLTLPLSISINHISLFIILFKWLILPAKEKIESLAWARSFVIFLPLYFFIVSLTLIYSENLDVGIKSIEKILFLLLIPVAFGLIRKYDFNLLIQRFANGFVLGNLAIGILFLYRYIDTATISDKLSDDVIQEMTPLHATYLSLFFACCILLLERLIFAPSYRRYISLFLITFFSSIIILTGSKLGVLFLVISLVYVSIQIIRRSSKWLGILFILIAFLGLSTLGSKSDLVVQRFKSIMTLEFDRHPTKGYNTLSGRLFFWSCAFEISQQNWLLGVGIGDAQSELDACYSRREPLTITPDFLDAYNVHNQFLQSLLESGIPGLLVLSCAFLLTAIHAFRRSSSKAVLIILLFFIFFLFESVLARDKGIVSFCCVICMTYYLPYIGVNSRKPDNFEFFK
jgi:O-antigen ligase